MKQIYQLTINHSEEGYQLDTRLREGKNHWVLPVVMLVEGVHTGNRGPLFYSTELLQDCVSDWNDMPVTIMHPEDSEGGLVPVEESKSTIVGRVDNTIVVGDKLKAEVWIDMQLLRETSEATFEYIKEGRALDVSTGGSVHESGPSGEWNGLQYRTSVTALSPNHLALLPDATGACGWDDGCGIRNENKNKKGDNKNEMKEVKDMSISEYKEYLIGNSLVNAVINSIIDNETGFREISQNIQQKLDQLDNSVRMHFLEEVFDDDFIYRVLNRGDGEPPKYFRREYIVQEDGSVEFEGDPLQVRKEVSFVSLKLHRAKFKKQNNKTMTRKVKPCVIDALINNEATNFTEDDREWLGTLEEDQLKKFEPKEVEIPASEIVKAYNVLSPEDKGEKPEPEEEPTANTAEVIEKDGKISINGASIEDIIKGVLNKETDPEKAIELMPVALRDQLRSALKVRQGTREHLITEIVANTTFKETNLIGWSDEDLQRLYDNVKPEEAADYSVFANKDEAELTDNANGRGSEEVESMLNLPVEKEEKKKGE